MNDCKGNQAYNGAGAKANECTKMDLPVASIAFVTLWKGHKLEFYNDDKCSREVVEVVDQNMDKCHPLKDVAQYVKVV